VLGELLHSLSQPLTSLRCSLELDLELDSEHLLNHSVDSGAERQPESVAKALQQTDQVIGMIQLMREYLDAERNCGTALAAVLRSLVEELESIAAVRGVELCLVGKCRAVLPIAEARLRMALQYLVAGAIDAQPEGGRVVLFLQDGLSGTLLRIEGGRTRRGRKLDEESFRNGILRNIPSPQRDIRPATAPTLTRARFAIAKRVFEAAGVSLEIGGSGEDFVLRICPGGGHPRVGRGE